MKIGSPRVSKLHRAPGVNPVHAVQFYEDDAFIVESVADFAVAGLINGETVLLIATPAHRAAIGARLALKDLAQHPDYIALDAGETLNHFLVAGMPHESRFDAVIRSQMERLAARGNGLRVYGEMVALLWADGKRDAALELERMWTHLGTELPFSLLCAYPWKIFGRSEDAEAFLAVCRSHSHVLPMEEWGALETDEERLRALAELQHRGKALGEEVLARQAAQRALERSERELADFFENGPVALHWVRADGIILRANRAELELLGYDAGEYLGHNIAEFHVDRAVIANMLAQLAAGETLKNYEARLRCKDGSVKAVLIDSNAYFDGDAFVHTRCVTRDITEAKRAEEVRARLATIVENSDDAIISKTLDGVVTSWNRGAERIFGYSEAEMIGQSITRLLPTDRADDFSQIIGALERGERVEHFETERIRKDGQRIHVSITVSAVRDAAGRIIGASKIARDVTERKLAEAEQARLLAAERRARAQAEAAIRSKDEFLSVISHELRTPLAAILGWVNVLKSGVSGEKAAKALSTIERSGRAQAKLIEDLLDVSRIITGRMRLDLRLTDLPAVISQAIDTVRPTADAKRVNLTSHCDPSAGPVVGDVDRLQQIVWNLLSNAIKFTPSGGSVELRLSRQRSHVRLTVTDTGRGIERDFLPFIFERFSQADRADSRRHGGLGLGLAIVRHLAELHGGMVSVQSEGEGKGSTFTVTLPLASADVEIDADTSVGGQTSHDCE